MNSGSTQFVPSRRMGLCEPIHQMAMWVDDFQGTGYVVDSSSSLPIILDIDAKPDNQSEDTSHGVSRQETAKPEKVLRRLAQNREAARKSRLRKKAYVQQLENCKQRLAQLEQEVEQARQQGLYVGGSCDVSAIGYPGNMNQSVAAFEMQYGRWVEEQNRHLSELRNALHSDTADMELGVLVDNGLRHYFDLFAMKASAAKADAFYVMSGQWKTSAERFFIWIGGFRPSDVLKVLSPHLEPLSEQQRLDIFSLSQSCQQAEDALSQGMVKLHQIVTETIAGGRLGEGNYLQHVSAAMEKLEALVRLLGQADHLRQETLEQISRILTTRQAARALLVLGDYIQRLQDLSLYWSSRMDESQAGNDVLLYSSA